MSTNGEIAAATAELARVDNKASMLLALAGGGGAVGAAIGPQRLPIPVAIPAAVALLLVGAAVWLLLSAVRPNLGGGHGFVAYAKRIEPEGDERRMLWLSAAVHDKYVRVRLAVDLLRVALLLAVVAAGVAVIF